MPADIRDALELVEAAQREGAETEGSPDDMTRRYALDEVGIVYLPELTRPISGAGLLFVLVAIAAAAAVIAGLSLIAEDIDWAPALVVGGALLGWLAMRLSRKDTKQTLARREGIERLGVHLLPSAVVIHEKEGCRIFPRERIEHFELAPVPNESPKMRLNLVYRDDAGASAPWRLETGTRAHLEPVFRILERWFGDGSSAQAG